MDFSFGESQGFMDRRDANAKTRREVVKAFEQFKKENPYATEQELTDAIRAIAGPSFYMRAAGGSADAIKAVADRNLQAKIDRDSRAFAAETQMRDAEEKRLEEQLYQGFLDSGDLTKSRDLILRDLRDRNTAPGASEFDRSFIPQLEKYVNDLDLGYLGDKFTGRYIQENKQSISDAISQGTTYEDFVLGSPHKGIVGSDQFTNYYGRQFADQREDMEFEANQRLNKILGSVELEGPGTLNQVYKRLGRFSDFFDPQIIEQRINQVKDDKKRTQAQSIKGTALELANEELSSRQTYTEGATADLIKDINDYNSQVAITAFLNSHVGVTPGALISLVTDIEEIGNDITKEEVGQILEKNRGNFVTKSDFKLAYTNDVLASYGLQNDGRADFATNFVNKAFGDPSAAEGQGRKGRFATVRGDFEENVKEITQPTRDYIKLTPGAYAPSLRDFQNHGNIIQQELIKIARQIKNVERHIETAEQSGNFYATTDEDYQALRERAVREGMTEIQALQELEGALEEAQNRVNVDIMNEQRRADGELTSYNYAQSGPNLDYLINAVKQRGYYDTIKRGQTLKYKDKLDIARIAGLNPDMGKRPLNPRIPVGPTNPYLTFSNELDAILDIIANN